MLNLNKKKTGYLHPYQAYLNLYKDRVMPVINTRYYMYRAMLKTGEEPESELKFRNRLAQELLEEEPDDVKRRVERFREFSRKKAKQGVLGSVMEEASPDEDDDARVEELFK